MRGDWLEEAEKNIQPKSLQGGGRGESNLQQESLKQKSCKRYQDLEAFQKAQQQKNGGALLGSQVATPPAGKGEQAPMLLARWEPLGALGSRGEQVRAELAKPAGAGGIRHLQSAEKPAGLGSCFSGGRRSWAVPQFPVQLGCCCFSSAGKKPSREMTITSS